MSDTRTQVIRFLVVGITATIVDASVYTGLLTVVIPGRFDIAKTCAFLLGTTVSYFLNKRWTFESSETDAKQTASFILLYGVTLIFNVGANGLALETLGGMGLELAIAGPIAFVVATGVSTVANFFGQKFWVFRQREA